MYDNLTIFADIFGSSAPFLSSFHPVIRSWAMSFDVRQSQRITGVTQKSEKEQRTQNAGEEEGG